MFRWIEMELEHAFTIHKKSKLKLNLLNNHAQIMPAGQGGEIWTHDLLVPNQARYQTALHLEEINSVDYIIIKGKIQSVLSVFWARSIK